MKRGIFLALSMSVFASFAWGGPRDELWNEAREAMDKRRPRTAIEHLETIYEQATESGEASEALKALLMKIQQRGNIEGGQAEEKIARLEAAMADASEGQRPLMEAALAHWYWQYFQQNRWRIMKRTQTETAPGEDIETWGLPRLFKEIDSHFQAALSEPERLLDVPLEEFKEVIDLGKNAQDYRPTLYDFLAFEAIRFYQSGEQAGARPEDSFVLEAQSPVFDPVDEFIEWEAKTTDEESPVYKGVKLLQQILKLRHDDKPPDAFLDANLHRIRFGHNFAVGPEKEQRYIDALARFANEHANHRISARARHLWAVALNQQGKTAEAQKVAAAGMETYPDSVGGARCHNLNEQILTPALQLDVERVWTAPWPEIHIQYKNLETVHMRVVERDWVALLENREAMPNHVHRQTLERLLQRDPAREWTIDLPPTPDYKQRLELKPVPEDLPPGFYALIASTNQDFGEEDNLVFATTFWVSDMALVRETNRRSGNMGGILTDARSGEPIAGATIRAWERDRRNNTCAPLPAAKTDEDGRFTASESNRRQRFFLAEHHGHRVASQPVHGYSQRARNKNRTSTILFTDRRIYRPGQTVHYKGICISVDREKNDYHTVANKTVGIEFRDANNKEIGVHKHQANDYGSFSGSFTAPRDRATGRMSLRSRGPSGQTSIRVEEYKRPKFHVKLDPPETPAKLGETVALRGTAESYTGAPVDGAKVRYRVVREVRYPGWLHQWRWWWRPPSNDGKQEIAHGTAETSMDGSFEISFPAVPDRSVPKDNEPIFRYTVTADVTDTTGETRSVSRAVAAGYTALSASVSTEQWILADKPFKLTVRTATLDGEPESATGTVALHALQAPDNIHRKRLAKQQRLLHQHWRGKEEPPDTEPDLSDPSNWELGKVVAESAFETDAKGTEELTFTLPAGHYRAKLTTADRFGQDVKAFQGLRVVQPDADTCSLQIPYWVDAPKWSAEPGETFSAVWGSGYERARAFVQIEHRGKILQQYWTDSDQTQASIEQEVTEDMRGGFHLHVTMVRENRVYNTKRRVNVPWSNKELTVEWQTFRSKLGPAEEETWTAIIKGPNAEPAAAEFAATLYDASLDAFASHGWPARIGSFYTDSSTLQRTPENVPMRLRRRLGRWRHNQKSAQFQYPHFDPKLIGHTRIHRGHRVMTFGGRPGSIARASRSEQAAMSFGAPAPSSSARMASDKAEAANDFGADAPPPSEKTPDIDLSQVATRTNLQETAFFYPQLTSGEDGTVRMEFTMPEALTTWRFLGIAHDRELRSGRITDTVTTSKDLMVRPNPPRFLREGDNLEFTVKVINQSPTRQTGNVQLAFREARTNDPADKALGNEDTKKTFDIPAKESRSFAWRISVPDGMDFLVYKAVASTGKLSDGEEDYLPVLPRRILVHESVPLHVRGPATKTVSFDKLTESGASDTLRHQSLTAQMVSNPAWYAVMALPYLSEQPSESCVQAFCRFYANSLGEHIVESDPRIARIFEQWRGTDALESPLTKNEDIKSVMLQETPWMRQADNETEARHNIGLFFRPNHMSSEVQRALRRLRNAQRNDGGWPWFPGAHESSFYITQYITCGFARLRHLGVDNLDLAPALKAVNYLDASIRKRYDEILEHGDKAENNLAPAVAYYLYTRSFFLEDRPVRDEHRQAVDYFLDQAEKHWTSLGSRQNQAHIALALPRFGRDREVPNDIVASLRERAKHDEEMGMYWRDEETSWWWYRAPIESQVMMIELFDEVAKDPRAVEECKQWLLKQKQTQQWKTNKATADAVYALLSRGVDLLADDTLTAVKLGDRSIEPKNVEAGTGFYTETIPGPAVRPAMGEIAVSKKTKGISWGGVHWQYFESVDKITPHEGNPLSLKKTLHIQRDSKKGPVLHKLADSALNVGDKLVVRIELRTDRDMEFVHLKDQRGSGTEPVNVLSRHRYQDGLRYYESTKDTATHFYIEYLPKGTYVFEYPVRVQHRGEYQSGIAHIECLYAPEFNSHSESTPLQVTGSNSEKSH